MLAKRIHQTLVEIANKAYPNTKHLRFSIEFQNRELISKYGDWSRKEPSKAVIRIFRMSENTQLILQVCIHELAHNTEFSLYGKTGHSKRFYEVYKNLLETSFAMGFLTYEDVMKDKDIALIHKHHGALRTFRGASQPQRTIIKVKDAFSIKDTLRERGYGYNSLERSWDKEVSNEDVEQEQAFLLDLTTSEKLVLCRGFDNRIEAVGYIVVVNEFYCKDELKAMGYRYSENGYGAKRSWVKKILMQEKQKEMNSLHRFKDIKVHIQT